MHHLSETKCYKVKSYFPVNYKMAEKTYDATLLLNPSERGWGGAGGGRLKCCVVEVSVVKIILKKNWGGEGW